MRGTGSIAAQLECHILGSAVPGGEQGDENILDGSVHVPVQLDAAVRARVNRRAAGRGGVLVCPVRGHAQPIGVRIPERRVPQGDAARDVQPEPVARAQRRDPDSGIPTKPTHVGPPAGQRVGAQLPYVVRRVPTLVRLGHATASRLCRHLQPGKFVSINQSCNFSIWHFKGWLSI